MSDVARPVVPIFAQRVTADYTPDQKEDCPSTLRCRIEQMLGSSLHLTQEMTQLLRQRLRLAALIALVPFVYFVAQHFLGLIHLPEWFSPMHLVIEIAATLWIAAINALLWSHRPLTAGQLRKVEVALFGSMAAFFAWTHFLLIVCPHVLDWIPAKPSVEMAAIPLFVVVSGQRWFYLIVLYGVFIPNTARRCAIIVLSTAGLYLLMTLVLGLKNPRIEPYFWEPFSLLVILMGLASAIAIFGSHRIHGLQIAANKAQQLGSYKLLDKLGAGGMGEVWLGEHSLLRRQCAIKVIHPDQAAERSTLERFEREVQAMARLTHPNTVEVYDYGHSEDGKFYYVMEYLPGMNLETMVGNYGPLAPGRAVHFLRQVCGALREAHQVGLLHRDIKPSNIIACERGGIHDVAKLLDFGLVQNLNLSKEPNKLTIKGAILGSPQFVSPEQARGHDELTVATDIYSLGGVAYFLLTGQPPFVRNTAMELFIAHASEQPEPPSTHRADIPADLEAIVLRCLEKKPERRFADIISLERALANCDPADEWDDMQAEKWWQSHGDTVNVKKGEPLPREVTTVALTAARTT